MIRFACFAALALLLSGSEQNQRFRTTADAVRVDVLVTDGRRPIGGLVAADFELRDEGVVQSVETAAMEDVPISVMFALDASGSVRGDTLEHLRAGVSSTLKLLTPRDRAALITFSSMLRLAHDWSGDLPSVGRAVAAVSAGGGTALWDATLSALTLRDTTPGVRRLVLVFSDGDDTASWLPRHAVIEKAKRTDAVLYGVSLRADIRRSQSGTLMAQSGIQLYEGEAPPWLGTSFLREVAEATGGTEYEIRNSGSARETFARVLAEFRTRYVLSYIPQGVSGSGWHPISVKLKTKSGKVTARRGYLR